MHLGYTRIDTSLRNSIFYIIIIQISKLINIIFEFIFDYTKTEVYCNKTFCITYELEVEVLYN